MSIRLFIADTDKNHIHNVTRSLSSHPEIRVIGSCGNGAHALSQLAATPADILLSDILLPGMDGFMLLRELQTLPTPPTAIMCTQFYSQDCASLACDLGATFLIYKPLDYRRLPHLLIECHRSRLRNAARARSGSAVEGTRDRTRRIRALLAEMGIPANLTGSMYLAEALLAASDDPTLMKNLSKGLYAEVAARMRSTPARMERALRNAIAIGCERNNLDRHFGHYPTNLELLKYLLDKLDPKDPA